MAIDPTKIAEKLRGWLRGGFQRLSDSASKIDSGWKFAAFCLGLSYKFAIVYIIVYFGQVSIADLLKIVLMAP